MPEPLLNALESVVVEDCRSVADWIVVTVQRALTSYSSEQPLNWGRRRTRDTDHRLTVRVPRSLNVALQELVARRSSKVTWDQGPPSVNDFILFVIERAIAERAALKKP